MGFEIPTTKNLRMFFVDLSTIFFYPAGNVNKSTRHQASAASKKFFALSVSKTKRLLNKNIVHSPIFGGQKILPTFYLGNNSGKVQKIFLAEMVLNLRM